jgi:chitin synthase
MYAQPQDAIARTDVPTDLTALIGQRRRWLNGSFFALVYTILNWGRVYTESDHSYMRKIFLCIQYAYMTFNVSLSWILPANFFLVTYYFVIIGFMENKWGYIPTERISSSTKGYIVQIFSLLYGISFLVQLVAGLGNKPKHIKYVEYHVHV